MQASNDFRPPIPVATAAPTRSGAAAMSSPASASACLRGSQREMGEAVHAPRGLEVDVLRHFEVFDLAGEVDREVGRVELGDLGGAGLSRDESLPGVLDRVSERAHHPETRHDDPAPSVLVRVAHRLHPEPAVHQEHCARDEGGVLGAEEPYRACHVLGIAEPSERVFSSIAPVASSGRTSVKRDFTYPGTTTFARTFRLPSSRASDFVNPMIPAFDAA